MPECLWTDKYLAKYGVSFPGEIPKELVLQTFTNPEPLTRPEFEAGGYKIEDARPFFCPGSNPPGLTILPEYHRASHFTPDQRDLLDVIHMSLFDLMAGKSHPQSPEIKIPTYQELIQTYMQDEIRVNPRFYQAMIDSMKKIIIQFDKQYPNLTPGFMPAFELIGGLGIGRAIYQSSEFLDAAVKGHLAEENKDTYGGEYYDRSEFVGLHGEDVLNADGNPQGFEANKEAFCLAPFVGKRIMSDAKAAALVLAQDQRLVRRYDPKLDLAKNSMAGTNYSEQIAGAFKQLGYNSNTKYWGGF